jgi:WG containing repeat
MKQIILILLFTFCTNAYAQVPRQEREERLLDMPVQLEAPPFSETAPDEVRGISYEKDDKKSFLMGDETKKGLYDQISFVHDNKSYIVKNGNLYGIANKKAEITVKIIYDSIGADNSKGTGFIAKHKGKYGKITNTGEIILPIKYIKIIAGNQYITLVENNKNETELIYNEQNKSLNKKIEYVEVYHNLTLVKSNGKFGVVKNEIILPFEYDSIFIPRKDPYNTPIGSNNKIIQKKNPPNPLIRPNQVISCLTIQNKGKFGLVNRDGKIIYPADNDEIYEAELFGYYSVKKDNLYGIYFLLSKDKKYTEIEFDRISVDGYGAIMASKNKKMGIFNLDGEQITPFEYDNDFIAQYSGIGYRVSKDKKRGLVDKKGNVIIPPIYDDISTFSFGNRNVLKVKIKEKYGIVNLEGKVILPIEFEYIEELNNNYLVITPQRKVGLYDINGNNILPAKYKWINQTSSQNSSILVLKEDEYSFNFLDKNNKIILPENVSEYGYVLDEVKLKSPIGLTGVLYVKNKNGKFGLLDEKSGTLNAPMVYDEIIQCTSLDEATSYFSVRKANKYGLINEHNEELIPIKYDTVNLTFAISTSFLNEIKETENQANDFQVVVAKGKKYGTVNLKDQVVIPFQYSFLQRISYSGLFKAKTGKQYQIIDKDGKLLTKNTFDEIANFERVENEYSEDYILHGLTFSNGKMRVIDSKGNFVTNEQSMQPHNGYETFDELKFALIEALDSKDKNLLKQFVIKIAPSEHILHYLKENLFDKSTLYVNIDYIKEKYLQDLLKFKYSEWNADTSYGYHGYNRSSLNVVDYTIYSERYGIVTNTRTSDHAYGDTRFMEKLLRDAIKINGYWISTYFMKRGFDRY